MSDISLLAMLEGGLPLGSAEGSGCWVEASNGLSA